MSSCKHSAWLKSLILPTIAVAIVQFIIEFAAHGIWLTPLYEQTAELWRPQSDMEPSALSMLRLFAFSFFICALYFQSVPGMQLMCAKDGNANSRFQLVLCFGVTLGGFMGVEMSSSYLWMPIPLELAIKWFIVGFLQGFTAALVIFAVDRNRKTGSAGASGA